MSTVAPWADRITGSGTAVPADLLANPRNWRIHPQAQQKALAAVLDTVGWVQQVIVNTRTGHVVDGHLRVSLAISREEAGIPVLYVDLSPEEEALVLASLDPLAGMAVTDKELFAALTADLAVSDAELAKLLGKGGNEGLTDPDAVPEPPEPVTKLGDLWLLGEHRVLCADATDSAAFDRLMQGAQAAMVWTDPPYGIDYVGKTVDALTIRNDGLDEAPLAALLTASLSLALEATEPGGTWWISAPSGEKFDVFAGVLRGLGLRRHTLVWVKDVFVMGRADYHYRHESLFFGWKPGAAHHEPSDRVQDTVWEIPRPKQSTEHPTMKPVELMARAIRNHTDAGELVLDPFLGSGSTLIAAEQEGRQCYGLEIDPAYCDVIVKRWENFTGNEAKLDG
jgi:DNA modification methylase